MVGIGTEEKRDFSIGRRLLFVGIHTEICEEFQTII